MTGTAALERFNGEWPFLKDGRTAPPIYTDDGCSVRLLCNAFLTSKNAKLDSGELSPRTFADYFAICEVLVNKLGRDRRVDDLRPDDFAALRAGLAKTWGNVRMLNEINRARGVFKFAVDQRLIDLPVHFGQSFGRPTAKTIREARHAGGLKLFSAGELKRILDVADVQVKGMALLGINGGLGNTDCATLPRSAVDLSAGWLDFPLPKTGIQRRVPLWPQTVAALKKAFIERPEAKDPADANLVFLTRMGKRWVRLQAKRNRGQKSAEETSSGAEVVVS
jgi:integrase